MDKKMVLVALIAILLVPTFADEPTLRDPDKYDVGSRLFSLRIEAITKEVEPGKDLVFRGSIFNSDLNNNRFVDANFTVKDVRGAVIEKTEKSIETKTVSTTFIEKVRIPENATSGEYTIEGRMNLGNTVWVDTFTVDKTPAIFTFFAGMINNIWTYILVLLIFLSLSGYKLYSKFRAVKKSHQKFVSATIDKLPKAGERSFWVGKVAETAQKSYINMDNLQMHSIIAGGTGSGKSDVAMVFAEEALMKKLPVVVFDPTGQWTGFIKPCSDPKMLAIYPKFGLRPEHARPFAGQIVQLDSSTPTRLSSYLKPGEITVFNIGSSDNKTTDTFVKNTIESIFDEGWQESHELKLLIIYDGIHKLLPKFGGKEGYTAIERGCREFRKWGIGLIMVSQGIMDFRGSIRTNIGTEIQLRTKYDGDITRVKKKYGPTYAEAITKLSSGQGLVQNPEYNEGKPWFVQFRPLLHNPHRISTKDLGDYTKFSTLIAELEKAIAELKQEKVNTYELELELNLAKEKIKKAHFGMAETYLLSVKEAIARKKGLA